MNYAVLTRQINDTVLTRQIIFAWKNAIFNPMNYVVLTRGLFYVLLTRDIQSKKLRRVNTGVLHRINFTCYHAICRVHTLYSIQKFTRC